MKKRILMLEAPQERLVLAALQGATDQEVGLRELSQFLAAVRHRGNTTGCAAELISAFGSGMNYRCLDSSHNIGIPAFGCVFSIADINDAWEILIATHDPDDNPLVTTRILNALENVAGSDLIIQLDSKSFRISDAIACLQTPPHAIRTKHMATAG